MSGGAGPILVVDDSPANLKLMQVLLEASGYRVITAQDADQALAQLARVKPVLVLLDIQLPGMDGLTLARTMRRDHDMEGVPMVAVTAFAMTGDREKALDAGLDEYITKPIDTRALPEVVKRVLEGGGRKRSATGA